MNFLKKIYPEKKLPKGTFKPAILGKFQFGADNKLVSVHGMDAGELYDLENDANETHNLWNAPEAQAIKVGMLKHLSDAMAWTVDPLPERPAAKVSADGGMEF